MARAIFKKVLKNFRRYYVVRSRWFAIMSFKISVENIWPLRKELRTAF